MSDDRGPSPELGGVADAFSVERASATPIAWARAAEAPGAPPVPAQASTVALPLAELEAWFAAVVTHPKSAADGVAAASVLLPPEARAARAEDLVTAGPRGLTATERLGIYQFAYHARLVECLADDYPVVRHALGAERFEALARRYIEAVPSRGPNLNGYGRGFASFCRAQSGWLPEAAFAADLARLEWALVEVIHAPADPALALAFLGALAPEQQPGVRLIPSRTLRFLELEHPANRYLQAVRRRESPELPAPEPSATAVYRVGYTVWRMDFTRSMTRVMRALLAGRTLGEALSTLAPEDAAESDVRVWFEEWVRGGFFSRFELSPPQD